MTATGPDHAVPDGRRAAAGCPLCGGRELSPARWPGQLRHDGRLFGYVACRSCGSLRCDPMPDATCVRAMYGAGYAEAASAPYEVADAKQPERVLRVLDRLALDGPEGPGRLGPGRPPPGRPGPGTFADFGCGAGDLLRSAKARGWKVLGVELDPDVAAELSRSLGLDVRPYETVAAGAGGTVDVLHLGDVIEHLTDPPRQLRVALSLLRPGGLVVAQGPLEANANLFNFLLRGWGGLRPARQTQLPPWHVSLATARGQRALFHRLGLAQVELSVFEVDWPAPAGVVPADLLHPRRVALYCLRRASVTATRLARREWGNRYFYVGRSPS